MFRLLTIAQNLPKLTTTGGVMNADVGRYAHGFGNRKNRPLDIVLVLAWCLSPFVVALLTKKSIFDIIGLFILLTIFLPPIIFCCFSLARATLRLILKRMRSDHTANRPSVVLS